jgi:hypothetical protein
LAWFEAHDPEIWKAQLQLSATMFMINIKPDSTSSSHILFQKPASAALLHLSPFWLSQQLHEPSKFSSKKFQHNFCALPAHYQYQNNMQLACF